MLLELAASEGDLSELRARATREKVNLLPAHGGRYTLHAAVFATYHYAARVRLALPCLDHPLSRKGHQAEAAHTRMVWEPLHGRVAPEQRPQSVTLFRRRERPPMLNEQAKRWKRNIVHASATG